MANAAGALKVLAAAVDRIRPPGPGLVILIYHRVGRRASVELDLPAELFDEQMAYLAANCTLVSLGAGLERVEDHGSDTLVAVTFDDGTADFADVAVPILDRHQVPATVYVATRFLEERQHFPNDGAPMSWAALRDARTTGLIDVGSHTHTHALLDRVADDVVADELDRSIGLIGERLGHAPADFAYPKAVLGSAGAQSAVRARFRSAAVAGTCPNRFGATDPYRLLRSPIQTRDGMRWFEHKARGGLRLEDQLRAVVDRRRYRSVVS